MKMGYTPWRSFCNRKFIIKIAIFWGPEFFLMKFLGFQDFGPFFGLAFFGPDSGIRTTRSSSDEESGFRSPDEEVGTDDRARGISDPPVGGIWDPPSEGVRDDRRTKPIREDAGGGRSGGCVTGHDMYPGGPGGGSPLK